MDWMMIAAYIINTVLIVGLVQYLKNVGMGWLKANAPWSLPIIAMVAGPLLGILATIASEFLGYPIDFNPLVLVLTGSLAVVAFDMKHVMAKMKV